MPRLTFDTPQGNIPTSTLNTVPLPQGGFQDVATGLNRLGRAEQKLAALAETNRKIVEGYQGYLGFAHTAQKELHELDNQGLDPLVAGPQGEGILRERYEEGRQQAVESGSLTEYMKHAAPLYIQIQERWLKGQGDKIIPYQKGQIDAAAEAFIADVTPLYGKPEPGEPGSPSFVGPVPDRNGEVANKLFAFLDVVRSSQVPLDQQNETLRTHYNTLLTEIATQGILDDAGEYLKNETPAFEIPLPIIQPDGSVEFVMNTFDLTNRHDLRKLAEQQLSRQVARDKSAAALEEKALNDSSDQIEAMIVMAVGKDPNTIETWRNNLAGYRPDQLSFSKKVDIENFLRVATENRSSTNNEVQNARLTYRANFGAIDGIDLGDGLLPDPIEVARAELSPARKDFLYNKIIERRKGVESEFDLEVNRQAKIIQNALREHDQYSDIVSEQDTAALLSANDFALMMKELPLEKKTMDNLSLKARDFLVEAFRSMRLAGMSPMGIKKAGTNLQKFAEAGGELGSPRLPGMRDLVSKGFVAPEVWRIAQAWHNIGVLAGNKAAFPEGLESNPPVVLTPAQVKAKEQNEFLHNNAKLFYDRRKAALEAAQSKLDDQIKANQAAEGGSKKSAKAGQTTDSQKLDAILRRLENK